MLQLLLVSTYLTVCIFILILALMLIILLKHVQLLSSGYNYYAHTPVFVYPFSYLCFHRYSLLIFINTQVPFSRVSLPGLVVVIDMYIFLTVVFFATFQVIRPNNGQTVLDSLAFIRVCVRYSILTNNRQKLSWTWKMSCDQGSRVLGHMADLGWEPKTSFPVSPVVNASSDLNSKSLTFQQTWWDLCECLWTHLHI